MKRHLHALGRLKQGEMNKTEQAYDQRLKLLMHAGEIVWYKFEGIKLRLADKTFLTVDFAVMGANGLLEMHDVKGARAIYTDDAKVKMKVAASLYPFRFVVAFPRKGGWDIEEV